MNNLTKNQALKILPEAFEIVKQDNNLSSEINILKVRISQNENKPTGVRGIWSWGIPLVVGVIMAIIFSHMPTVISITIGVFAGGYIYTYTSGMREKKKLESKVEEYNGLISESKKVLNEFRDSNEYRNTLSYIPAEYRNTYGVSELYNVLYTGRADSWKEAINKVDEIMFRRKNLSNQETIIGLQRDALNLAERNNIELGKIRAGITTQSSLIASQIQTIRNQSRVIENNTRTVNKNIISSSKKIEEKIEKNRK